LSRSEPTRSRSPGRDSDDERAAAERAGDAGRSPLAFDSFDDPAFDRFVERLSRRLERRERIERERRGH
jgi:hypothetical protein